MHPPLSKKTLHKIFYDNIFKTKVSKSKISIIYEVKEAPRQQRKRQHSKKMKGRDRERERQRGRECFNYVNGVFWFPPSPPSFLPFHLPSSLNL